MSAMHERHAANSSLQSVRDKVLGGDKAYTGDNLRNSLAEEKNPAQPVIQGQPTAVKQGPDKIAESQEEMETK